MLVPLSVETNACSKSLHDLISCQSVQISLWPIFAGYCPVMSRPVWFQSMWLLLSISLWPISLHVANCPMPLSHTNICWIFAVHSHWGQFDSNSTFCLFCFLPLSEPFPSKWLTTHCPLSNPFSFLVLVLVQFDSHLPWLFCFLPLCDCPPWYLKPGLPLCTPSCYVMHRQGPSSQHQNSFWDLAVWYYSWIGGRECYLAGAHFLPPFFRLY